VKTDEEVDLSFFGHGLGDQCGLDGNWMQSQSAGETKRGGEAS
jgi:hypothetical protein